MINVFDFQSKALICFDTVAQPTCFCWYLNKMQLNLLLLCHSSHYSFLTWSTCSLQRTNTTTFQRLCVNLAIKLFTQQAVSSFFIAKLMAFLTPKLLCHHWTNTFTWKKASSYNHTAKVCFSFHFCICTYKNNKS